MADLLRVSILGLLPGSEEWSVNPCFSLAGDFGGVDVTQSQLVTIATAINAITVPTSILAALSAGSSLVGVRVEARTWGGVLEAQADAGRTPVVGTGIQGHPFQSSVCLSLRTAHPGPSGRGRLFWPATGIAISSGSLRIDPTTLTNFVTGMKTYLGLIDTAITATLPTGVGLVVWSRKNLTSYGVNQLEGGDVVDVQRRRRDQLVEARSTVAFP